MRTRIEMPSDLLHILADTDGKVMTIDEYLQVVRENSSYKDWIDFPIVDRRIGIVISKRDCHDITLALLGMCSVFLLQGESLARPRGYWHEVKTQCIASDSMCNILIRNFIKAGGYYFSSRLGQSISYRPACVCLCGRHMDEADQEIIDGLRCRDFDYPHG